MTKYVFNYYGCPETEMWTKRAQFEEDHQHLDLHMKMDSPHYSSANTRIAYTDWEKE